MKPANCFSVEYILGVHNDKRKENVADKRKLSNEEDDVKRMKVGVKIEEKQEKSHSDDDHVIITSEKGITANFFVTTIFLP